MLNKYIYNRYLSIKDFSSGFELQIKLFKFQLFYHAFNGLERTKREFYEKDSNTLNHL